MKIGCLASSRKSTQSYFYDSSIDPCNYELPSDICKFGKGICWNNFNLLLVLNASKLFWFYFIVDILSNIIKSNFKISREKRPVFKFPSLSGNKAN